MRRKNTPLQAFYEAVSLLNRPLIWVPLLAYLAFKVGLIFIYRASFLGPMGAVWALFLPPDVRGALVHYPWDLIYLPLVLGRLNIGLDIAVSVVFQGATIVLFANALRDTPLSLAGAFRATMLRYRPLVGVTAVSTVVLFGLLQVPALLEDLLPISGTSRVMSVLNSALGIAIQAMFLYALPFVLLTGYTVRQAITGSVQWARRSFGQTALLVVLPFLITIPTMLLGIKSPMLVSRLAPEIMIHLEIATEVAAWLSTLLLTGGLTTWFVRRRGRELVV